MKERHKRQEIFSLLLVSNFDNKSRQFSLSALQLKLIIGFFIIFCIGIGVILYSFSVNGLKEYQQHKEVDKYKENLLTLQEKYDILSADYEKLTKEMKELQRELEEMRLSSDSDTTKEEEEEAATSIPKLYPIDGSAEIQSTFSQDNPYLTILVPRGRNVIATGHGIVRLIDYHDSYLHSIEIDHLNGYISRYFCNHKVNIEVEEGDEVEARSLLFSITSDDMLLFYQTMFNNEMVNPIDVMKE